jgi:transcription antitermination factor NusG
VSSNEKLKVEIENPQHRFRKQWFALCTRARHEKAVRERLCKKEYEEFLPTFICTSQWSDRTKKIETPLFPGYCFARFENSDLFDVLQVPGVCYAVGSGGQPESIPEEEIEALKRLMTSAVPYSPHQGIAVGMLVQIARGPLAGIRGRLMRQDGGHYVIIGVDLIKLGARVKVQANDVIPVMEPLSRKEGVACSSEKSDLAAVHDRKQGLK